MEYWMATKEETTNICSLLETASDVSEARRCWAVLTDSLEIMPEDWVEDERVIERVYY